MNPLQKAWLTVLKPVVTLVNDKMARKSGLIGKVGRFFAFGPRQFGYHPINKYFKFFNTLLIQNIPLGLHRYSFIKNLNENSHFSARPYGIPSLFGMLIIFYSIFYLAIPSEFRNQEGTTLEHLTRVGLPAHYNALNDRVSAHFTEINSLYEYEMMKRFDNKIHDITRKRQGQPDRVKKTRYARPGYNYIEAHANVH